MLKSGFFFKMELNVCLGKLLDVSVGWGWVNMIKEAHILYV